MAVPSGHHIFPYGNSAAQGGTILGNDDTSTKRITKSFSIITALDDNEYDYDARPSEDAASIYEVHKPLSASSRFNELTAGEYILARSTNTLAGVSKTQLVFMGRDFSPAIAQFQHDFGVKLLTAWRNHRFSWTGTLADGTKTLVRSARNWLNTDGTAVEALTALAEAGGGGSTVNMWAPGGATRNGTGAAAAFTDAAANGYANPTYDGSGLANSLRGVPGRLVMKSNFVDKNVWTSTRGGSSDFYLYKPITGM